MHILKLTLLLAVASMVALTVVVQSAKENKSIAPKTSDNSVSKAQLQGSVADSPGTIDGAKNPELIPDHVAYSLLFRFLCGRRTEAEKNFARSYIAQMGLGNAERLLAVADEYKRRVAALDEQAKEIRRTYGSGPNAKAQLRALQEQKVATVTEICDSLASHLGRQAAEKIRAHVNERIKRKVKIFPPQASYTHSSIIDP